MPTDPKSIYFFLIPPAISRDNYAHASLVLAEGLVQLGYRIYANLDYWRTGPEDTGFLFRHDPEVKPADCAINVLSYDWLHYVNVIPFEIKENQGSLLVYIEDADWPSTPGLTEPFRIFDTIFKAHFNHRCAYPSNFQPWSFGLSNRIIREVQDPTPFAARARTLLVNFGSTHSARHHLRDLCEERLYPKLHGILEIDRTIEKPANPPADPYHRLMWEQSASRHYPGYYRRLQGAAACSCFGGRLMPPSPPNWSSLHGFGRRSQLRLAWHQFIARFGSAAPRANQWESWRFWESLASGCATFMLDFEKYGMQLPVQPVNGTHYVGIDLDRVDDWIDRVRADPALLGRIGSTGRSWALEHYSPLPTARRFLERIGEIPRRPPAGPTA